MTDSERLVARVEGKVQGVGFRYWIRRHAARLGVTGWVSNLDDDRSLQVMAEGGTDELAELERLLHVGPPGARVDRAEVRRGPASGEWQSFEIVRG